MASLIIIAVICLALGFATGYGVNSEKTRTVITTQNATTVETVNVTVTPYCCIDPNLSIATPCSAIMNGYPPLQRLLNSVENDPVFIAAEQGHNYLSIINGGCSIGSSGEVVNLQFACTLDTMYTDNCGDAYNFSYFLNVNVPLTDSGYNMSAIQIIPTNVSQTTVTCASRLTTSENNVVTITTNA
jgi:hypothetical protein